MAKLKPVMDDAQVTHTTTVEGKKVTTTFTVKPHKDGERYALEWTMDYANVSEEQLLRLANRTVVIAQQAVWRKATDRTDGDKWNGVTFDVAELLERERTTADPLTRAKRAVDKLSKAERDALLKALAG